MRYTQSQLSCEDSQRNSAFRGRPLRCPRLSSPDPCKHRRGFGSTTSSLPPYDPPRLVTYDGLPVNLTNGPRVRALSLSLYFPFFIHFFYLFVYFFCSLSLSIVLALILALSLSLFSLASLSLSPSIVGWFSVPPPCQKW